MYAYTSHRSLDLQGQCRFLSVKDLCLKFSDILIPELLPLGRKLLLQTHLSGLWWALGAGFEVCKQKAPFMGLST